MHLPKHSVSCIGLHVALLDAPSAGGETAQEPQDQQQCAEQRQAMMQLQSAEDADLQQHVAWAKQHLPDVPLGTATQHCLHKALRTANTVILSAVMHAHGITALQIQRAHTHNQAQSAQHSCLCSAELVKGLAGREQINAYGIMAPSRPEVSLSTIFACH